MIRHGEIINVGNELLIGKTPNTNAQWLAKRLTTLGLSINQTTTIRDDIEKIAETLREAIQRKPDFIIITGGLGPTFDDKTLEGVAKAFNSKLKVNKEALKMVEKRYLEYAKKMGHRKFELTQARIKMATIPEAAEPLQNPLGTAPAVMLKEDEVKICVLPGVPAEMKAIFETSLMPIFRSAASGSTYFEASLFVDGVVESEIAPLIDQVMHDHPYIYIKSHPLGAERSPKIELHISTTAENSETARKRVSTALMQLEEIARTKGGKTRTAQVKSH